MNMNKDCLTGRPLRPEAAPVPEDLPALERIVDEFWGSGVDVVDGHPLGCTNRNYLLDIGDESFVVRVPGADTAFGIDRQAELEAAQAAAKAGK
jgi:hypothetical protein